LRRVLQNLVSNAIKYTSEGRVLMGCRRLGGGQLRIEIHDTGPGIPESKRRLVFREFERLDQNAATAPGLGLGLSIVDRIARMLKHTVGLRSSLGKGSVFTITLPVQAMAADNALAERPQPAGDGRLADLTVLVIDNEPAILKGMESLLAGWGCKVLLAHTSSEALALWQAHDAGVDLILADYHLDREDGLDVVAMLRGHAGRYVPAILITADRSRQVQDLALAHDMQCLRKPLRPAALRAAINHAFMRAAAE
jgi:CheY-like chemotaxis protein/anti-sigma regulatory factor (Ser/Thr protein kinase)